MAFISSVLSRLTDSHVNTAQREQQYTEQPGDDEVVDDFIMIQDDQNNASGGWGPPPPLYHEVIRSDEMSKSRSEIFQRSRSASIPVLRSKSFTAEDPPTFALSMSHSAAAIIPEPSVEAMKMSPIDDIPLVLSYFLSSALQLSNLDRDTELLLLRSRYDNAFDISKYNYPFDVETALLREFGEEREKGRCDSSVETQQNDSSQRVSCDDASVVPEGELVYPHPPSDLEGQTLYDDKFTYPHSDNVLAEMADFGFCGQPKLKAPGTTTMPESDFLIDFSQIEA